MPNWCSNTVIFTGEKKNLKNLNKLLHKTADIQEKTGQGQLLHSLEGFIDGYMFYIGSIDLEEDCLRFSFDSKWNPIPNDIIRIAELFNLEFTYDYEECGMGLYGKYTFEINDDENCLYEQMASDEDINLCKTFDENGEEESMNYEKLEECISHVEMYSRDIIRLSNATA